MCRRCECSYFFSVSILTFPFALMQKKSNKRKNQGCIFLATPALFSAKEKELATLKQLFLFNAPKSTSASRQKNEANRFARWECMFIILWAIKETPTSNSEAHLNPDGIPAFSGGAWRIFCSFPWRRKSCLSVSEFFFFRERVKNLAPERQPAVFLFCYLFSFCCQKEKSKKQLERKK